MFNLMNVVLYTELPNVKLRGVRYWDLASTKKNRKNDPAYSAGVLQLHDPTGVVYIDNVVRMQESPDVVQASVLRCAELDDTLVKEKDSVIEHIATRMEQEPGSAGVYVINEYSKLLRGFDFKGDKVTGSKEDRARPFAAWVGVPGRLYVRSARWTQSFLDELEAFPNSSKKDQIDAATGGYAEMTSKKRRKRYKGASY